MAAETVVLCWWNCPPPTRARRGNFRKPACREDVMNPILMLAALIPALPVVSILVYGVLALVSVLQSGVRLAAAAARGRHRRPAHPQHTARAIRTRRPDGQKQGAMPSCADNLLFVFVIPCLNEERVIAATLDRLLTIPGENWVILVVDDGSDDETAKIASQYVALSDRVRLLRRYAPEVRQGKGAALNAAYRHLRGSRLVAGRRSDDVIVVVVDADGRLQPGAPAAVTPIFADPRKAAVQIGVRMYNRQAGWLARMQDMEFLIFTEVFQRARHLYGNAGMGGNGQFVRLSALESLGEQPWTSYLTEDLDMGLRLQLAGWRTAFTPNTYIDQQGLTGLRALIRQRTRWYQGHLQCWSRIPLILRSSQLSVGRMVDLMVYLVSPISVLLITLALLAFLPSLAAELITQWDASVARVLANHALLIWWYLLVLGVVPMIAFLYSRASRRTSDATRLLPALGYAVLFSLYAYIWLPVAWRATWRLLRRRGGWTKTLRLVDQPAPEVPSGAVHYTLVRST
jgi:1,2-diacylglycerol 3-beta-glucosyltransferase